MTAQQQNANQAIRSSLEGSDDPRVARTRSGILEAVRALSEAGEELSAAAIARAAGISRASFYAHYAGLDDLANSLRRDAFRVIAELYDGEVLRTGADALKASQDRLVAHFAENRGLYAAVSALPVSKQSYLADVRAMAAVIERELAEHPAFPDGLDPVATARYVAGAAYGLLDAWIAEEVDLTEPQLVEHLLRLLPSWFSRTR
ncbi:TetR/AcrR family transcriptional regulator [Herbiconiux sp. YIM B11900]|uniref:TetR/AcrR family transcriptional regulator n=1 Tax=Herbiconiux sp. YIM B11900 TaxID=3404131 RepID=UPI003F8301B9